MLLFLFYFKTKYFIRNQDSNTMKLYKDFICFLLAFYHQFDIFDEI
jgi:hypothetical protein